MSTKTPANSLTPRPGAITALPAAGLFASFVSCEVLDALLRVLLHQNGHEITNWMAIKGMVLLRHYLRDLGTLDIGVLLRETVDHLFDATRFATFALLHDPSFGVQAFTVNTPRPFRHVTRRADATCVFATACSGSVRSMVLAPVISPPQGFDDCCSAAFLFTASMPSTAMPSTWMAQSSAIIPIAVPGGQFDDGPDDVSETDRRGRTALEAGRIAPHAGVCVSAADDRHGA